MSESRQAVQGIAARVGVVRVATNFVEFDVHAEGEAEGRAAAERLAKALGSLKSIRKLDSGEGPAAFDQVVEEAKEMFNEERFWECHEALEGIWRKAKGEERRLLNGIILVAVAFVHQQRGRFQVSPSVFKRAYENLHWHEEVYRGISISSLRKRVGEILDSGEAFPFKI